MPVATSNLLDRYLHAVKFWLPKAQQQDILAELHEDLRSQMEERERALGRPLDEEDMVAILKQRGSPMRVASGYLAEQRIINPAMMPAYRLVLKIVLLWVLAPLFAVIYIGPVVTSGHPERVLLQFWSQAWQTGFMVIGMVTAIFAIFDRYHVKIAGLDGWDPRKLPRIPAAGNTSSRWECFAGFVLGTAAAVFWALWFWQRTEFAFPGGIRFVLGPIWSRLYWPVLGFTVINASVDLAAFLYPRWIVTRARIRLGLDCCLMVAPLIVLKAGNWGEIAVPNLSAVNLANAARWLDYSIQATLVILVVCSLIDAVQQIRLLHRRGRTGSSKQSGLVRAT